MKAPRNVTYYFDNCGENKNKEMFTYFSLLVETGVFETIEVYFLIVGHTHGSLDQYFSTLSIANHDCQFIGTPMALQHLYQVCHKDEGNKPTVNRQLRTFYDYKEAFKPYLNSTVKYYQIPHCFLFKRVNGIAVMQYRLYSTHKIWLPKEPSKRLTCEKDFSVEGHCIGNITSSGADLIGLGLGSTSILEASGVGSAPIEISKSTPELLDSLCGVKLSIGHVHDIECNAICQNMQRMEDESSSGEGRMRYGSKKNEVNDISTWLAAEPAESDGGYITWITFSSDESRTSILKKCANLVLSILV